MNAPAIHSIFAAASFSGSAGVLLLQEASRMQAILLQNAFSQGMGGLVPPRLRANPSVMRPASRTLNETARRSASLTGPLRRSWRIASEPKTVVVQNSPDR